MHLNPETQTPPVGCPLLIELPGGSLIRVERREWAKSHDCPLMFYTETGAMIVGRYRWTYP